MKTLLGIALAGLSLASTSLAVTWDVVRVSIVVKQGSATGNITTLVLSSRAYLNFVSDDTSTPKSDLFIGFREDTGEIAVVRKSDETVLYRIVSGLGTGGLASNGTGTVQSISVPATISSLNTDFSGFVYDSVRRSGSGSIKSVTRQVMGGFQNQTIKGTCTSTGKKIEL